MFLNYILPLIVSAIYVAGFVTFFTLKYKNADESKKLLPIKIIFFALIITEVAKIFYLIAENEVFEPLRYPVVFCSMVMFAYPLFCFKPNRLSEVAKSYSVFPSLIVTVTFIAVQGQYNMSLIQGHSYFFHASMTAVAIYLLTAKLYTFKFKNFFNLFLALSAYLAFSTVLSLFIGGDISLFGPESGYAGFLYNAVGYAVGNILLIILMFVLCVTFYAIAALFSKKKTLKTTEEAVQ